MNLIEIRKIQYSINVFYHINRLKKKTYIRHNYTLTRIAKIKKIINHTKVGKDGELNISYDSAGNVKWYKHFRKQFNSFLKNKRSRYLLMVNENMAVQRFIQSTLLVIAPNWTKPKCPSTS